MSNLYVTFAAFIRNVNSSFEMIRSTISPSFIKFKSNRGLLVMLMAVALVSMAIQSDLLGKTLGTSLLTPGTPKPNFVAALTDSSGIRASYFDSTIVPADSAILSDSPVIGRFSGRVGIVDAYRLPLLDPAKLKSLDSETLWLARAIFSETKRPEEQELIAWVVRNRVETRYRGKSTYKDVVLDPYQFSAFIPGTRTRDFYANLTPFSRSPGWKRAIAIAYFVRHMNDTFRPFSIKTRHFYSEQSMVGRTRPDWASDLREVTPNREFELDERRFRFYAGIS